MVTTADRLKELMEKRNLRQVDIINKCQPFCNKFGAKLGKSDLSQYLSGKVVPSQYKLTILGLALDVNEAWLIGLDVAPERKDKKASPTTGLTEDEELMLDLFRLVPDDKKALVIEMIRVALNTK